VFSGHNFYVFVTCLFEKNSTKVGIAWFGFSKNWVENKLFKTIVCIGGFGGISIVFYGLDFTQGRL